ncbi:MAG: transporter substrate-binding domain-containing protein [candidate division SR1 bacterium]|nr:transporter substrate-binding domain-containing protein [candidate division SR1 bacterium]
MLKKSFTSAYLISLLAVSLVNPIGIQAQTTQQNIPSSVHLGVKPLEPFVISQNGQYSGFSIDLWNNISKNIGITTTDITSYPNVNALIDSVSTNQTDVGIAGISITADRENKVDFSYPMFHSGISILTTSSTKGKSIVPDIFSKIWVAISNYEFLQVAIAMILISILPAIAIYLAERRDKDGFLDTPNIIYGVFLAYCWCLTGIFGQEERHPSTKTGKFFGIVWMVFGVLFLAFFTAQITATLTTEKINGTIHSIDDIKDKRVATIKGTTSSQYLKDNSIDFVEFDSLSDAVNSIDNKETVAVVFDKPALDYFASKNKTNKYSVVGGIITSEDYGIVLPTNSLLRKKINEELLKMYQNGDYDTLKAKWFGKSTGN